MMMLLRGLVYCELRLLSDGSVMLKMGVSVS